MHAWLPLTVIHRTDGDVWAFQRKRRVVGHAVPRCARAPRSDSGAATRAGVWVNS